MCCNDPAPVDPGPANAANANAAADLSFRTRVYDESKPWQAEFQGLTRDVANSALEDARLSRERGAEQYSQYMQTFRPIEQKMASEAMEYGSAADQERQAGSVVSDVRQQGAIARGISARAMASMGVNPNSGRFAGMDRGNALRETAMAAGGANSARLTARDKGIGLRAGAAAFGRNQVNTAGQMTGLAGASGAGAVNAGNAGFMAGLPYANFQAGGYASGMQAAGIGQQGAIANANNAANSGMDLGGLIGGAAKLYTAFGSDRRLKEDIVLVGHNDAVDLNIYEFAYVGVPNARFRGVMADEVAKKYPNAVAYRSDGMALVNYDALGLRMEVVS